MFRGHLCNRLCTAEWTNCNAILTGTADANTVSTEYCDSFGVRGYRRHDHVTPILRSLHGSVPVPQRVVFKTAIFVQKCVHGFVPASATRSSASQWKVSEVVHGNGLHRLDAGFQPGPAAIKRQPDVNRIYCSVERSVARPARQQSLTEHFQTETQLFGQRRTSSSAAVTFV